MKTENNPWAAMDAIINANPEPMGEEWFFSAEYAKRYGCTPDTARHTLTRMRDRGMVEQWTGKAKGHPTITSKWRVKPVS